MATGQEDDHTYRPLCFGYLASYLRRYAPGFEIGVFDRIEDLIDFSPDLAGFSATSTNFNLACKLARQAKEALGVPLMIGGVHISVLPQNLPSIFDLGVLGEGERTLVELAELFLAQGGFAPQDLSRVAGICYRDRPGAPVAATLPRPLIRPLDSIPFPDRELIGHEGRKAYMFTSRGCPYDCRFCSSQRHWGSFRTFSAEYVLEEIGQLIDRHNAREIHFFDDLFVANSKRLATIAEGIVERGWQKEVEFSCTIRANLADERLMETLKLMEIKRVTFGAESNSDPILRYLKGDNVTSSMNQRAVDLCHRYDIRLGPSFIKGAPQETGDDLLATYDFILRNIRQKKIDYFEIHNLTPFPGTPIWDHALERGLVSEDMNWDELKVPWENLFLNQRIPKSAFYFFESLTKKGRQMLGIFDRRLIGVVDLTSQLPNLDREQADQLAGRLRILERDRFFDQLYPVNLSGGSGEAEKGIQLLAERSVEVVSPQIFSHLESEPDKHDIICYFEPTDDFKAGQVYDAIWRHFDTDVDLTRYADTSFFTPVSKFLSRIFVFSSKAFVRAYRECVLDNEPGRPLPDLTSTFMDGDFRIEIYRPDQDPFVEASSIQRLFQKRLFADFKLDRMNPDQQQKRLAIIEQRIIEKTQKLPALEKKRRDLAGSRLGRWIVRTDSAFLKALVKFFLYRD